MTILVFVMQRRRNKVIFWEQQRPLFNKFVVMSLWCPLERSNLIYRRVLELNLRRLPRLFSRKKNMNYLLLSYNTFRLLLLLTVFHITIYYNQPPQFWRKSNKIHLFRSSWGQSINCSQNDSNYYNCKQ